MKPSNATAESKTTRPVVGEGFSLVLGGPLYQLLFKAKLMRPPLALLHRRMLVIPVLAWLPLLFLTLIEGTAIAGVGVPFLSDIESYVRFLLAMPILLFAEVTVDRQLREVIFQLRTRGVVPADSVSQFEEAIAATARLRTSTPIEIALVVIVFLVGPWAWHHGADV